MTAATPTSWDKALKNLYRDSIVERSTYKDRPMLGILAKYEGFTGRNMPQVNVYGNPQGRSASFTKAQTNTRPTSIEGFDLDIVSDYSIATITGEVVDRTESDRGAFLKAMKKSIDYAMDSLADAIETFIPRSGAGDIGQISSGSTVTNQTVTLEDTGDVTNFEVGMTLVAAATTTGSVRTGTEVLAGVDRSNGVITATSAAWDTVITAIAASDYLFVDGDAQNGGSAALKISGFQAWLPSTAPTGGDSFFGVDRSVDSRLYGTFHDGSSQSMEDAIIDAQSKAAQQGGSPDVGIINHVKMRRFTKELGSKKEHTEVNATGSKGILANAGYRGICVHGDKGEIRMVAANKCPSADGFLLERANWEMFSIKKCIRLDDTDGNRILRQGSSDGYEVRVKGRFNVRCENPIGSARVTLPG